MRCLRLITAPKLHGILGQDNDPPCRLYILEQLKHLVKNGSIFADKMRIKYCMNQKVVMSSCTTLRPFSLNCGRAGIRTLVPGLAEKPLSRRPQSSTLAPPQFAGYQVVKAEGEGFEPPEAGYASMLFKSTAFSHSAIPPGFLADGEAVYHGETSGSTAHLPLALLYAAPSKNLTKRKTQYTLCIVNIVRLD